jgi:ubiquinone/menaquinone biosynthesis C-methylase UbiE
MNEDTPWHERFFAGAWQRVQPNSFSPEDTRQSAEALRELLQLDPGATILDVPCGEGRIAEHFAHWGYRVTGVDRSEAFLAMAQEKAGARDLQIDYRQANMWQLDALGHDGSYDAALSIWSSIGYATEEDDRNYFRCIYDALKPGGALVVDTQCLETLLSDFEERQWYQAGEILVAEQRHFDPVSARVLSLWTFAGADCFEQTESSLRIYSYRELESMLAGLGFADFESYGSMELEEFELTSPRLVLVARRP